MVGAPWVCPGCTRGVDIPNPCFVSVLLRANWGLDAARARALRGARLRTWRRRWSSSSLSSS